ncbi:hypothetical protein QBC40DRAFT_81469 [Triangularia verruculosa]|uniref:Uncharacterized protein n=1 Tax=Triangularia verruculosa TaxID=2587418 RepID=A0AAN6XJ97_9PEZI|nr:hypothetical protein QBC40DRAFT_81469 [Triangularia verruculosa]
MGKGPAGAPLCAGCNGVWAPTCSPGLKQRRRQQQTRSFGRTGCRRREPNSEPREGDFLWWVLQLPNHVNVNRAPPQSAKRQDPHRSFIGLPKPPLERRLASWQLSSFLSTMFLHSRCLRFDLLDLFTVLLHTDRRMKESIIHVIDFEPALFQPQPCTLFHKHQLAPRQQRGAQPRSKPQAKSDLERHSARRSPFNAYNLEFALSTVAPNCCPA